MLAAGAGARYQRGWAFRFCGVRTTGVFAALRRRSKRALRKMFALPARQALDAGFRLRRCQPDNARAQRRRLDKRLPAACRLLEQETPVTLARLCGTERWR